MDDQSKQEFRRRAAIEYVNLKKAHGENQMKNALLMAATALSAKSDTFCSSTLAIGGGTVALVLANLDRVISVLGGGLLTLCLSLLAISVALGLRAKWLALKAEWNRTFYEVFMRHVEAMKSEGDGVDDEELKRIAAEAGVSAEIDMDAVIKDVLDALPSFEKREFKRPDKFDPLAMQKKMARLTSHQLRLVTWQTGFFYAFGIAVILSVAFGSAARVVVSPSTASPPAQSTPAPSAPAPTTTGNPAR